MGGFIQHSWTLRGGSKYSVSGEVNASVVDAWFSERVYTGNFRTMYRDLDNFYLLLQRMHQNGNLPGYDFLFQMPDYEREDWIAKACHKLTLLNKENPTAFPADGVVASFDRLRAWRKAKSKTAKNPYGGVSKMALE